MFPFVKKNVIILPDLFFHDFYNFKIISNKIENI